MSPLLGLSGFGGGLSRFGGATEISDEYFNYVTMLLHGDGTNGAQNNTFTDSSSNNFTITRNGNTTQGTLTPFGDNWSNYFDGSGDYLSFSNNSNFAFGTGAFTIEFWVNGPSNNNKFFLGGRSAIGTLHITTGGYDSTLIGALRYVGSSTIVSTSLVTDNSWHHCAIVRDSSNNVKLYVDGVQSASGTDATNYTTTSGTWYFGGNDLSPTTNNLNGFISNLRILKGTALYTTNFTPPTAPLTAISGTSLLTCQSNRFKDNSTNNFTLTPAGNVSVQKFSPFSPTSSYNSSTVGGSLHFLSLGFGSGDYLSISHNTALDIWVGNFTVECWVWLNGNQGNNVGLVNKAPNNGDPSWTPGWAFQIYSNALTVNTPGDSRLFSTGVTIPTYSWVHCVLVKSGSTVSIFQNGTRTGTITNSSSYSNSSDAITVGTDRYLPGGKLNGYVSNLRLVKGTAVYDPTQTTITVPTAPLTNITNTSLLLNGTNAGIFDNAMMNNVETVGNAQINTSTKKYGTGSMAFDGSGDYLIIAYTPQLNFPTNFTIECWVNVTSTITSFPCIVNNYSTYTTNGGFGIFASHASGTANKYNIAFNGTFPVINSTTSISYGNWQHIALVRSGSTITLYVDGVSNGTHTSTANVLGTQNFWWIGTAGDSIASGYLNGYIDDLRVTNGFARYTTTFTPPTRAFPNK